MEFFLAYLMDYTCSMIKPNCDGIVLIADLKDTGYAQFFKDHLKRIA